MTWTANDFRTYPARCFTFHREAALITFLVTLSGVVIAGIGSAFWGVVAGAMATAMLLTMAMVIAVAMVMAMAQANASFPLAARGLQLGTALLLSLRRIGRAGALGHKKAQRQACGGTAGDFEEMAAVCVHVQGAHARVPFLAAAWMAVRMRA